MGYRIIVLLLMSGLGAAASAEGLDGVMLKYMVSEQGLEPYPTRIIVTDTVVRMDDGESGGDYLLFDREKRLIRSVTHGDATVLEIPARELAASSPIALQREQQLEADTKAPEIGGRQPHTLRLLVNEQPCYDAVVVPGLMPDVVKALRDFNRLLAGEQGKRLADLPAEVLDGCDLALHTFHPEWPLESGLAIQEYDHSLQRGRLLVDIDQAYQADAELFKLPADYRHYTTP